MIYRFEGREPSLPEEYYVDPSATVIGDVTLGEQSSVWCGAVLRGDIEPIVIGARSNIQDNSVVHTSRGRPVILGDDVTVGHQVTLHGCKVGNTCLIGMGATLLDGCEIGDNCMVAAGALVTEGQKVPTGFLVMRAPARVVRELSDDEIARVRTFADRYVELQARYNVSDALKKIDDETKTA